MAVLNALRPRDKDGWLVPKRGTLSRTVYNLMAIGMGAAEIAAALGTSYHTARSLKNHIKYPERHSARQMKKYFHKRPRPPCQSPAASV